MNKKRAVISAGCLLAVIAVSAIWLLKNQNSSRSLTDEALLALIKNDQKGFEAFMKAGGNVHDHLPEIEGKTYSVAEGIAYFERMNFANYLHQQKVTFMKQNAEKPFDIMTITVKKNNPELLDAMLAQKPNFLMGYQNGWTMLHMASAWCSHRLTQALHEKGQLRWDHMAKDGSTPLTLAAESDCLPMLSYWKDKGADFRSKDGKGRTALSILRSKKDAALQAFAASFEERTVASVTIVKEAPVPDFYKKRKIPKDQVVDHAAMLEPEDRPLEATETAEFSEFAD